LEIYEAGVVTDGVNLDLSGADYLRAHWCEQCLYYSQIWLSDLDISKEVCQKFLSTSKPHCFLHEPSRMLIMTTTTPIQN